MRAVISVASGMEAALLRMWPFGAQDKSWTDMQIAINKAGAQVYLHDTASRACYAVVPKVALGSRGVENYRARQQKRASGRRTGPGPGVREQLEAAALTGANAKGPWAEVSAGGTAARFTVKNVGNSALSYDLHLWPSGAATHSCLAAITSPDGWLVDAAVLHRWPDLAGAKKAALQVVEGAGDIQLAKDVRVRPAAGTVVVEGDFVWHPSLESASPYWPLAAVGFKDGTGAAWRVFVSPTGRLISRLTRSTQ